MTQPPSEPTRESKIPPFIAGIGYPHNEVLRAMQGFQSLQPPLLGEPAFADEIAAAKKIEQDSVQLSSVGNPKNVEKRNAVMRTCSSLVHFARHHPWLTAGMAIAFIFLMLSFQTAVSALAQQTDVNIFNIHYVIGGGVAFMFLMYAIMLNNMRRRAIAEKKRDASYEAAVEALKKSPSRGMAARGETVKTLNREIKKIHEEGIRERNELQKQKEELEKDYKQIEETKQRLEVINDEFNSIFRYLLNKLQLPMQKAFAIQMAKVSEAVIRGAQKLQCPEISAIPQMPVTNLINLEAEIPSNTTSNMEKNKAKAKKVSEKINGFFTSIGSALKSNPESKVYYSIGFIILGLAGLGLYLWLHGYSQAYFLGLLTPTTLVPMSISGLCLVYEGWNKGAIDAINKNREKIIESQKELDETQRKQEIFLEKIQSQSEIALQKFRKSWEEYLKEERLKINAAKKAKEEFQDLPLIEAGADSAINIILAFFPEVKRKELASLTRSSFAALTQAASQ